MGGQDIHIECSFHRNSAEVGLFVAAQLPEAC
jgi:hypothetical protein